MLWIAAVVVVAVVLALLRGGKLANLVEIRLTGWPLLPLGFGLQIVAELVPADESYGPPLATGLILVSYVALLLVTWLNRARPGMWLAGLGILLNFTVIALNGGMPVLREAVVLAGGSADFVVDAKHVLLDPSTRLMFLADVIPLPGSVLSIGDVLLAVGLGAFLEHDLRRPVPYFRHGIPGVPGSAARR